MTEKTEKTGKSKWLLCAAACLLTSCSIWGGEGRGNDDSLDSWVQQQGYASAAGALIEQGGASWYGERFRGRSTASGEPFNPDDFTAAHKSLPFGTQVRVVVVQTGQSVVVRINDRGPFVRGRVIDLSKAAAQHVGIQRLGVAQVRLEYANQRMAE